MASIGAGLLDYGKQEYGLTGIKRPPNYGDIIGTQAAYLPQLYAMKKADVSQEKSFKLQEESLAKEIQLARDRMAQIESLGGQELASNEALSRERMELDRALSGYETSMNTLLANQRLEQEKKQSMAANIIGLGQTGATGLLAAKSLGWIGGGTTGLPGATGVAATQAATTGGVGLGAVEGAGPGAVGATGGAAGVSTYLGPAGAGFGAGSATSALTGETGTKGGLMGAFTGGTTGFAVSGGNPIGAAIGAVTGFLGGSGKCCFIFIASHGFLHPIVRKYRDKKMNTRNRRGYYWLADKLVPLMEKNKIAAWMVKWLMVKPMTCYGKYYYNLGRMGALYAPITAIWRGIFNLLGHRPPYQRQGTEEVV